MRSEYYIVSPGKFRPQLWYSANPSCWDFPIDFDRFLLMLELWPTFIQYQIAQNRNSSANNEKCYSRVSYRVPKATSENSQAFYQ